MWKIGAKSKSIYKKVRDLLGSITPLHKSQYSLICYIYMCICLSVLVRLNIYTHVCCPISSGNNF